MKIKPLFDRIAICEEKEEQTESGIFLGKHETEGIKTGKVLFVPTGEENADGKKLVLQVKEGDTVLFNKYSGVEAMINKKSIIFVRQTDILAVLE